MNRYQKKINKITKQRMFMLPGFRLRVKFRKIRKQIRKLYKIETIEKDFGRE